MVAAGRGKSSARAACGAAALACVCACVCVLDEKSALAVAAGRCEEDAREEREGDAGLKSDTASGEAEAETGRKA